MRRGRRLPGDRRATSGPITRRSRGSSQRHEEALAELFGAVLALCAEAGLVRGRGGRDRRHQAARRTRAATRSSTTSGSPARSSRRRRPSTRPRTSSTARRAATSCRPSWRPQHGPAGVAARRPSAGSTSSAPSEARPIPRSRPQRLNESKRRLEEELWTERQANAAYEAYRARGVMKDGRRFGAPARSPTCRRRRPRGEDQHDRSRLAAGQGDARLAAGLQRAGRRSTSTRSSSPPR